MKRRNDKTTTCFEKSHIANTIHTHEIHRKYKENGKLPQNFSGEKGTAPSEEACSEGMQPA